MITMNNDKNNRFLVKDENGLDRMAIMIEIINIGNHNYGVYGVFNNRGNYDIHIGILTYEEDVGYKLSTIYDVKEHEMIKKLIDKQIDITTKR